MKSIFTIAALLATAAFLAACGAPAANTNATNTNTNAAKTAPSAPTADALLEMDKKANEAYIKGDSKYFETMLDDKFVSFEGGSRISKKDMLAMIGGNKCEVKDGWKVDEPQMTKINDDTYALTYKTTMDGSCTMDGKSMKIPSPTRATSVWVRNGDKWNGVFHAETLIIDPKAPPAAPTAAPPAANKPADKPAAEKKADPAAKDDKAATNSNTAAPAKPTPGANTEALVKSHTAGWEAFKNKDAKYFEANLTAGFAFVDPIGGFHGTKADTIKTWTETMKCEGITKVAVTDGFASAISPTLELLTLKGTADGTCDGQKNGDLWQSAFYVKEGEVWKLAFMFESPAM